MTERCPYCGQEYYDKSYLYQHAMTEHREAVLAHWVEQHDVSPRLGGQQRLQEAMV